MKAYTSSSSSRAMSVARVALGSSTTSPESSDDADESLGLRGSRVMQLLREQVPAEQIAGVRALHVRSCVHDYVPGAGGGRIDGAPDGRFRVGVAQGVGRHLVQADRNAAPLLAAAQVDVRDVLRDGLKAADGLVDRHAPRLDDQCRGANGRGIDPDEFEADRPLRCRRTRTDRGEAW